MLVWLFTNICVCVVLECGGWYIGPACRSDGSWHRTQRHAVVLHHRWEPGPDLQNRPYDGRDSDPTVTSWQRKTAAVHTHCDCGRWWHATFISKCVCVCVSCLFFFVIFHQNNLQISKLLFFFPDITKATWVGKKMYDKLHFMIQSDPNGLTPPLQ